MKNVSQIITKKGGSKMLQYFDLKCALAAIFMVIFFFVFSWGLYFLTEPAEAQDAKDFIEIIESTHNIK